MIRCTPAAPLRTYLLALPLACVAPGLARADEASAAPPAAGLEARHLAIVVNDDDPDSVAIGAYYQPGARSPRRTSSTCASRAARLP